VILGRWRQQVIRTAADSGGKLLASQSLLLLQPQQSPRPAPSQGPIFFTQVKFGLGLVLPLFKKSALIIAGIAAAKTARSIARAGNPSKRKDCRKLPKRKSRPWLYRRSFLPQIEEPPPH